MLVLKGIFEGSLNITSEKSFESTIRRRELTEFCEKLGEFAVTHNYKRLNGTH